MFDDEFGDEKIVVSEDENGIIFINCDDESIVWDSVVSKERKDDFWYSYSKIDMSYEIDDCVLVRTTDAFPFRGVVETPAHGDAFVSISSEIFNYPILKILRKKYSGDELLEEMRKYNLCIKNLRNTIHFCINGLVGNHMLGNFSGRSYVIVEPLKYHITDSSLRSLAVHDTYFEDDMYLSDEAILIITEKKYNQIKDDPNYIEDLKKFKIFVFSGKNQYEAVCKALNYLGYDCFTLSDFCYSRSFDKHIEQCSVGMTKCVESIRKEYNIDSISHFGSRFQYKEEVDMGRELLSVQLEHFHYILDNSVVPEELLEKIKKYEKVGLFDGSYSTKMTLTEMYMSLDRYYVSFIDTMDKLIECIGLENIERLTKEFNEIYVERYKKGHNNKKK